VRTTHQALTEGGRHGVDLHHERPPLALQDLGGRRLEHVAAPHRDALEQRRLVHGAAAEQDVVEERAGAAVEQGEVVRHERHPPDAATANAHARTSSGVNPVSEVRSMTQSGSLSHSRRCMKDRVSVLRKALTVAGSFSA
jgi:hypothetical protein